MNSNLYLKKHDIEKAITEASRYFSVISVTYHVSFEKHLAQLGKWIKTPVAQKLIVDSGEFENTTGNIHFINHRNLHQYLSFQEML